MGEEITKIINMVVFQTCAWGIRIMAAPWNRIARWQPVGNAPKALATNHFGIVSCAVVSALGGLNVGQRMLLEHAYQRAKEVAARPNRWRVEQWSSIN